MNLLKKNNRDSLKIVVNQTTHLLYKGMNNFEKIQK